MKYLYSFTEDEYVFFIKEPIKGHKKFINYKLLNKIRKFLKIVLIILMICLYLIPAITMVGRIDFLIIWGILYTLICLIMYFISKILNKTLKGKFSKYSYDNGFKVIYKLYLHEKDRKELVLDDYILNYYTQNEIIMINCNLIKSITKNEKFLVISYLNDNIYIPRRVLNSLNEEDEFIDKINSHKDNTHDRIYTNINGISTEKILIDDKDIKEIINYSLFQKGVKSKLLKILLPIIFIEIVEVFLINLLLHVLNFKIISIILILAILLIIVNFIIIPKVIKNLFRKILTSDKNDSNGYRICINESGIYNLKENILTGSNWNENLSLAKYNDSYFVTNGIRVIAYIPTKSFQNIDDKELFINKINQYLKERYCK